VIRIKRAKPKIRIRRAPKTSEYWSIHTHSKFSAQDALPSVADIVSRAKELGYPALGLTDHGNIAGSVQLYQECQKAGIKPFPGSELYIVEDRKDPKAKRYHMCVVAFSEEGYRNLIHLSTLSHKNFHFKPILDLADLADLASEGRLKGIAATTGCFFGMVIQKLISDGYDAAKRLVAAYASWFDVVYVELQNHEIEQEPLSEREIASALVNIADELDLKCVITQDSHYTHPDHKADHENMKRLVTWSDDPGEAEFPGDGFHLVDERWMQFHHLLNYDRGIDGLQDLLARHTLVIPELDTYDYRVPVRSADPAGDLVRRCEARLLELGLFKSAYRTRLAHELDILAFAHMEGYLLLVAEVTDYCREHAIFFQARGSASGSLICWLLGITSVDPLKWGLLMERFLSKDRTKPPDVDLDIESDRRQELMDYLSMQYSVAQIGTWSELSMSGDEDGKGSLRVKMMSTRRKQGKSTEWEDIPDDERKALYRLSDMAPYAGYGVHAAGLLMTSSRQEMDSLVPMMWVASSKKLVSQYDMKDVEKLGLVKLDVLGLKTMSVLHQTLDNMGLDPKEGLDFIPLNDRETYKMIAKGDTAGVFQLEGGTAARGMRELKPSKISDIIAAMALYRPATMTSGATEAYIRRKHKQEQVPERHELIARHTKDTHGILLYQEQVIAFLRDLGLDPDELTKFLKAVKASNGDIGNASGVIEGMLDDIKMRCYDQGMTDVDVRWLEEALEAYAGYGFNSAHATVYGLTAYRCAYLAVNHPVEFHAALLSVASGSDKEPGYVSATRRRGVRILRPDINTSGVGYRVDTKRRGVRRGLLAIKGVGAKAAAAIVPEQPFSSLEDLVARVDPRAVTGLKPLAGTLKTHEIVKTYMDEDLGEFLDKIELVGVTKKLYEGHALDVLVKEED